MDKPSYHERRADLSRPTTARDWGRPSGLFGMAQAYRLGSPGKIALERTRHARRNVRGWLRKDGGRREGVGVARPLISLLIFRLESHPRAGCGQDGIRSTFHHIHALTTSSSQMMFGIPLNEDTLSERTPFAADETDPTAHLSHAADALLGRRTRPTIRLAPRRIPGSIRIACLRQRKREQ
jgi:hypothetical protein